MTAPPKAPMAKYGWKICDEVQRFVSNTSEVVFVPMSDFAALKEELTAAKAEVERLQNALSDEESLCDGFKEDGLVLVDKWKTAVQEIKRLRIECDKSWKGWEIVEERNDLLAKAAYLEKERDDYMLELEANRTSANAKVAELEKERDAFKYAADQNSIAASVCNALLTDCEKALELIARKNMDPAGPAYGAIKIAKETLTRLREQK